MSEREVEMNRRSKNKVVLIGDFGVGKTTLFMRFKKDEFVENVDAQQKRQEAEHPKTWTRNGEEKCLTLYDTAGMERFDSTIPPTYFRHAKAVIFVYAIDNQESIDNIVHWSENIAPQRLGAQSEELIRVLVGNKLDMEESREITTKRGRDTADVCGFEKNMFFEVSAKTGEGVDNLFDTIASQIKRAGQTSNKTCADVPVPSGEKKKTCCV